MNLRKIRAFIERDAGTGIPLTSWRFWSPVTLTIDTHTSSKPTYTFTLQIWGFIPPALLAAALIIFLHLRAR